MCIAQCCTDIAVFKGCFGYGQRSGFAHDAGAQRMPQIVDAELIDFGGFKRTGKWLAQGSRRKGMACTLSVMFAIFMADKGEYKGVCPWLSFDDADLAVQVFANSHDEAAGLFQIWHYTQFGEVCHAFGCEQMSPWLLIGDQIGLREDMDGEQVGIAGREEDGVWRVLPPDHSGAGA